MKVRVAFDTNIILDVLLGREPFVANASALFAYAHEGRIEGLLAATSLTTVFYLIERKRAAGGGYCKPNGQQGRACNDIVFIA